VKVGFFTRRSKCVANSRPGRSAARSDALQTRDRFGPWRSRISGAPLRCRSRCTASGTHNTDDPIRHSCLTMSNSPSRSRGAFLRPGFGIVASPTRIEGWAERRETFGCSGVGRIMTRYARRLRGALRPMTRDARLSALHRGGFGLPGPRFRLLGRPPSYNGGQVPCGSVQRAPRTQVVVPGGRGPCLPRRAVTSRRRRTPLPAPPSGSSPETPLNERG
jgi:hypothetical protein